MEKVLVLASVASMIDQFNMPNIELLKDMGYEVHVACNFEKGNTCSIDKINELKKTLEKLDVKYFQIDFARNVLKMIQNIKAYKQVYRLMKENKYKFIHCHSPIGGVCGRIAAHRTNTKVIYTAHGFHFYKGAPIINWLIYYPIERILARYTDILITINKEDYNRAKKFKAKKIEYIPGVGIDVNKINNLNINKQLKRDEIGVPRDAFVLLSVGELNKNKNHEVIIRALAEINNPNIYYVICGEGYLKEKLIKLANNLRIKKQVQLLGFRSDIKEIYKIADIFVFPSYREGLSVALMEAMASELPCIVSNIRGNEDLIINEKGGYLINSNNIYGFSQMILKYYKNRDLIMKHGDFNKLKIEKYSTRYVTEELRTLYNR